MTVHMTESHHKRSNLCSVNDKQPVLPFVLREAGIVVNDKAKIHTVNPMNDDHEIIFKETGVWIPLTLWGVFSYFATVKPTEETLHEGNDVFILTPETWHPHLNAYAHNEDSMVDWEGNICAPKDRKTKLVFDNIPDDGQVQSTSILATEAKASDDKCETTHCEENEEHSTIFPQHTTNVFSLTTINDPMWMTKMMEQRAQLGCDQMLIGSMTMVEMSNLIMDDES